MKTRACFRDQGRHLSRPCWTQSRSRSGPLERSRALNCVKSSSSSYTCTGLGKFLCGRPRPVHINYYLFAWAHVIDVTYVRQSTRGSNATIRGKMIELIEPLPGSRSRTTSNIIMRIEAFDVYIILISCSIAIALDLCSSRTRLGTGRRELQLDRSIYIYIEI